MAVVCSLRSTTCAPTKSLLSMALIVSGALLFIVQPSNGSNAAIGVLMALTSSLLITLRNLKLKDVYASESHLLSLRKFPQCSRVIALYNMVGTATLCIMVVWLVSSQHHNQKTAPKYAERQLHLLVTCGYGVVSGICHALYTYISTALVLKSVSAYSHSLAGVCKRMATVLLLYAFGQRRATRVNVFGFAITSLGLLLHIVSHHKAKRTFLLGLLSIAILAWVEFHIDIGHLRNAHDNSVAQGIRRHGVWSNQHTLSHRQLSDVEATSRTFPEVKEKLIFKSISLNRQENSTGSEATSFGRKDSESRFQIRHLPQPRIHGPDLENQYGFYNKSSNNNNTPIVDGEDIASDRRYNINIPVNRKKSDINTFQRNSNINSLNGDSVYVPNIDDAHSDEGRRRLMTNFLHRRLIDTPLQTNKLSRLLNQSTGVVRESQRILENLLRDIVGEAKHAMLMETSVIENKGDPAITVGELLILKRLNLTLIFHCSALTCTDKNLDFALKLSSSYDKKDIIVFMQGGGSLVLYKSSDDLREKVIRRFSHFKMVLLSQSLWFTPKINTRIRRCQSLYSRRPNLTIFLRDKKSLQMAQNYFHGTALVLAPDMAFCMGSFSRNLHPVFDILWIRRRDLESSKYPLPQWNSSSLKVRVEDWIDWKTPRGVNDLDTAVAIAHNGLSFLQRGRIVITDRLHGHIMSVLMDIPHVLIDNPPAQKLSSYHQTWTASLSNAVLVNDAKSALTEAIKMLKRYSTTLPVKMPYVAEDPWSVHDDNIR